MQDDESLGFSQWSYESQLLFLLVATGITVAAAAFAIYFIRRKLRRRAARRRSQRRRSDRASAPLGSV